LFLVGGHPEVGLEKKEKKDKGCKYKDSADGHENRHKVKGSRKEKRILGKESNHENTKKRKHEIRNVFLTFSFFRIVLLANTTNRIGSSLSKYRKDAIANSGLVIFRQLL
jgi:hypothetical protein